MKNKEFQTYPVNSRGLVRIFEARQILDESLTRLGCLCTLDGSTGVGGREFAIVRTKFEEASFFAIKAISLQTENQIQDEEGNL